MRARIIPSAILGLLVLAGCGSGEASPIAIESSHSDISTDDSESASDGDISSEPSPDQEDSPQAETTTTTTTAPAPLLTSEDAIERYDRYVGDLVEYTRANLVDGDGTYDHAKTVLAHIDPALLGGELDDVALAFHNCSAEGAISTRAFYEISDLDLDIEHVAQHEVNVAVWALELRQFIRVAGFPETVNEATVLVTVDGVGPTIETTADDDTCEIPRSPFAEALISEAKGVLAIPDSSTSSGELRSADEVVAERAASASLAGTLGEAIELRNGLKVNVRGVEPGGDSGGPWLVADVRVENTGTDTTNPELAIVCAGSIATGGWQADSTFDLYAALPSGTFNEGTVNLLLPGDGRYGEAIPECATPAAIRVSDFESQTTADFPIPDETIEVLLG